MEAHETRRKANIEAAKTMLNDTKRMAAETACRVSKLTADYEEGKKQHLRKMQKLESIYADHCKRLDVLEANAVHLSTLLQPRPKELIQLNEERKEELRKYQEEEKGMNAKFSKVLEELEDQVSAAYAQIREERDLETELEMELDLGLSGLKPEDKLPIVNEVIERRKRIFKKRQEERQKGIKELEEAQKKTEEEIKVKTELLAQAKQKHAELVEEYKIAKMQNGNCKAVKHLDKQRPTPILPNSKAA